MSRNRLSPFQLISLGYLVIVIVGALFLMVPFATVSGASLDIVDAIFTAASAVCVTGLVVVHTADTFSFFGQIVLLLLIQIGGLGYMAMVTSILLVLRRKVSLRDRFAIQESFNHSVPGGMVALILNIIKTTLLLEMIGAALLFLALNQYYSPLNALWQSVFHAISAFCNSGLDLFQNSLTSFVNIPLIPLTIAVLVIAGGLGFTVLDDLKNCLKQRSLRYLSFHSKLVLLTSFLLLVIGFTAFRFYGYSLVDSFFMSVTARTAGFTTVTMASIPPFAIMSLVLLMFIGASPGGTGGGIKTTTLASLLLPLRSTFINKKDYEIFGRRVSPQVISRALALFFLYILIIIIAVSLIHIIDHFPLRETLFEIVSALGTVGLSLGITPHLSIVSKFIIVLLMLLGRIGPLTLSMSFFASQGKKDFNYPEGRILT